MADNSRSKEPEKNERRGFIGRIWESLWWRSNILADERRGFIGRTWDSLLRNPNILAGIMYLYASSLGMLYALSYYHPFDIDIFKFAEPLDFLFVVFSKTDIVLVVLLGILLVVVGATLLLRIPVIIMLFVASLITLLLCFLFIILTNVILLIASLITLLLCFLFIILTNVILLIASLITLLLYSLFIILIFLWFFAESLTKSCWQFMKGRTIWASDASRESPDAEQRTFRESLADAWKALTDLHHLRWEKLSDFFNNVRGSQRSTWGKLPDFFENVISLRCKLWEKYVVFVWRPLFYPVVLATLILGTVYVPRHQGERDAHVLLNAPQSEEVSPDSLFQRIDSQILPIYSRYIHPLKAKLFGQQDSQQKQHVRVTIRQDTVHPQTRLPESDRTILVGTTNSFHFFYECGNVLPSGNDLKNGASVDKDQKCGKGRPFIIPTANIASLEFSPFQAAVSPPLLPTSPPLLPTSPPLLPTSPPPPLCQWEEYEVTHFHTKESELLGPVGEGKWKGLVKKMDERFEDNQTLRRLTLIGRADVMPYLFNNDLARSRAGWIKGKLLDEFQAQIDPQQEIPVEIAAPRCTSSNDSRCDLGADRSVEVRACWAQQESD